MWLKLCAQGSFTLLLFHLLDLAGFLLSVYAADSSIFSFLCLPSFSFAQLADPFLPFLALVLLCSFPPHSFSHFLYNIHLALVQQSLSGFSFFSTFTFLSHYIYILGLLALAENVPNIAPLLFYALRGCLMRLRWVTSGINRQSLIRRWTSYWF